MANVLGNIRNITAKVLELTLNTYKQNFSPIPMLKYVCTANSKK